jgi:hypothetical protein
MSRGAKIFDLRLFRATVWKLVIIESFSKVKNKKKSKLKTVLKFENILGCCGKALDESDLIRFTSQFSELRCGRY